MAVPVANGLTLRSPPYAQLGSKKFEHYVSQEGSMNCVLILPSSLPALLLRLTTSQTPRLLRSSSLETLSLRPAPPEVRPFILTCFCLRLTTPKHRSAKASSLNSDLLLSLPLHQLSQLSLIAQKRFPHCSFTDTQTGSSSAEAFPRSTPASRP